MTLRQEVTQAVNGIGQRMRQRRLELGLNQCEVAKRVALDVRVISRWETARNRPDLASLLLVCRALECSIDTILGGKFE